MNINLSLFGQAITFAIFVWFTMKYVWPPITEAMAEREKKIADGLAAAEQGNEFLAKAEIQAKELVRDGKVKATEVIENANKRASQIVDEAKTQAREEGERLLQAARAEIEQETLQAREKLRQEIASIAILGAEKILAKSVDEKVHEDLLTQLAANI